MTTDLPLTPEDVNEITSILDGSSYDKLDIRTSRLRLRVQRSGEGWTQQWSLEDEAAPAAAMIAAATVIVVEDLPDGVTGIPAPLPGTFYRAPQPGAPPFVEAGDIVGPETVVGIVETMKLMNPVHAGCSGRISAICIENATMVDGGAVLMHVEPA